jgi:sugar phosphate isomerase/epimerase
MLPEKRYRGGVNGDYFRFRIPGYGEINWAQFISALDEIGYTGNVAIEHEDPVYWDDKFDEGLARGWQVLNPLIHPGVH